MMVLTMDTSSGGPHHGHKSTCTIIGDFHPTCCLEHSLHYTNDKTDTIHCGKAWSKFSPQINNCLVKSQCTHNKSLSVNQNINHLIWREPADNTCWTAYRMKFHDVMCNRHLRMLQLPSSPALRMLQLPPPQPSGCYNSPPPQPSGCYKSPPPQPSGRYNSPPPQPSGCYNSPPQSLVHNNSRFPPQCSM